MSIRAPPPLPDLEQHVLQEGKRAAWIVDLGQDRLHQARFELQADEGGRFLHGPAHLVGVEGPDEELLGRDPYPQLVEGRAAVVEVGPHAEDDEHPPPGDGRRIEEVGQEGGAFVVVGTEGEELLELVHHQDDAVADRTVAQGERRGQVEAALVVAQRVERLLHRDLGEQAGHLRGQRAEGTGPGAEDADGPVLAPDQGPATDGRHQPRLQHRALAAARRSEHGQEPGCPEAVDERGDVVLPPEEEPGVLLLEHLQPPVGTGVGAWPRRPPVGGGRP